MIKYTLPAALMACLFYTLPVIAQKDTTSLDAGTVVLKKDLTQTIRIKGTDLEQMPFTDLGTALGSWLYGAYSNYSTLTYVVDGNVVSDVNMYSIYDIDEVVLVQNAAAQGSLGIGMQQLVLITTKRGGKGKGGLEGAFKDGIVTAKNSTTNLYEQYYLRGYQNTRNTSFGLSADYQRDVVPVEKDPGETRTAPVLDRLRLNGYLTIRAGQHNTVDLHAGYAPEKTNYTETYYFTALESGGTTGTGHQHIFTPSIQWKGEWLPGLTNELQATYLTGLQKQDLAVTDAPGTNGITGFNNYDHDRSDVWYVRDRLSLHLKAGDWSIEPSVNGSFEHFNDAFEELQITTTNTSSPGSVSDYTDLLKTGIYFVTPAIDLHYKDVFDLQGGTLTNVSHAPGVSFGKRLYPFATLSAKVLHWGHAESSAGMTLYGAYAKKTGVNIDDYALNDLSGKSNVGGGSVFVNGLPFGVVYASGLIFPPSFVEPTYWTWSLGGRLTFLNDRLSLNYHFERFNAVQAAELPSGTGYELTFINTTGQLHNIGLYARIGEARSLSWETGLNTTVITQHGENVSIVNSELPVGDYNVKHPSWTGGFVNRLRYKQLSLGADMQYRVNELPGGTATTGRINSFLVQDIYAGYALHLAKGRTMDVYLNSRNFVQNSSSTLTAHNRYYGVGGKIAI